MKTNFKKILTSALSLIMLVVLVACGSKEPKLSMTAKMANRGLDVKLEYYAVGDKVKKMVQESVLNTSNLNESQIEKIKTSIKKLEEKFSGYEYAKYEAKFNDNSLVERFEFDFSKKEYIKGIANNQLLKINPLADYISLKKSRESLEKKGYSIEMHK